MSNKEKKDKEKYRPSTFPAKVIRVLDDFTIVINRGSYHGIEKGISLLVYNLSDEELIDPDTKEMLGNLEIVRGTGEVVHVQERLSTIKSITHGPELPRRLIRRSPIFPLYIDEGSSKLDPFENIQVGDIVRPI